MTCCLCDEQAWLNSYMNTSYQFNVSLIETLHYHLSVLDTNILTNMIDLVKSYVQTADHISGVIRGSHTKCLFCSACGHFRSVSTAHHDEILRAAIIYYTGLSDQQAHVLERLKGCINEMIAIDQMIGMVNIKQEFVRLLKFLATIDPNELKKNSFLMHMVIMGPPGHGKTEVAKLLGNAFKKSGLLSTDKFVIATRADLIGKYCGHTAKQTTEMFNKARGGVIFIDEVYALGNSERRDVFTGECINTINQLLSERSDTLCIIAGYEQEIAECFFSYNPGLERRFPWRFHIKPYTESDLIAIFHKKMADLGHKVDTDALLESDLEQHRDMFPNAGGDIVNLVTNCMLSYYDHAFMDGADGREVSRKDVLAGLQRYLSNRKVKEVDPGPPLHMYS